MDHQPGRPPHHPDVAVRGAHPVPLPVSEEVEGAGGGRACVHVERGAQGGGGEAAEGGGEDWARGGHLQFGCGELCDS